MAVNILDNIDREAGKSLDTLITKVNRLEANDYFTPLYVEGVTSDPPTPTEISALLGTPESFNANTIGFINDTSNSRQWLVYGDTSTWFYLGAGIPGSTAHPALTIGVGGLSSKLSVTAGQELSQDTIAHSDLTGIGAEDHHDLVTIGTGGLSSKLALSGQELTLGVIDHNELSNISPDDHHNPVTIGTGGLSSKLSLSTQELTLSNINHSDLSNITANQHHNQIHDIVGSDHTVTGSQFDLVGLTATNTIGLLTPSSNPGTGNAILRVTTGAITLHTTTVSNALYLGGIFQHSGDLTIQALGGDVFLDTVDLETSDHVLNTTGWGVYQSGSADFRSLYTDSVDSDLIPSGVLDLGSLANPWTNIYGSTLDIATSKIVLDSTAITLASSVSIETDNYVADTSGWQILYTGVGELDALTIRNHLEAGSGDILGALDVGQDLTVGTNVLFVDQSGSRVGINMAPDPQFQLDITGNLRASGYIVGQHAIQLENAQMIVHFDGPGPFATNFTGSALGHRGQIPTITGPEVYRPGKFDKSLQVAEATTNYAQNPLVTATLAGWDVVTGGAISASDEFVIFGTHSAEVIFASGTYLYDVYAPTSVVAEGSIWTVSAFVYAPPPAVGATLSVNIRQMGGTAGTINSITSYALVAGWQRVKSSITVVGTGASVDSNFQASNVTLYFNGMQIEQNAYVTPLCYGDMPGHTWGGTPHASTSIRAAATIKYDNPLDSAAGTVAMYWQPAVAYSSQPTGYLFDDGSLAAYFDSGDKKIYFTDGTNTISTAAQAFAAGDWLHLAFVYGDSGLAIHQDGASAATGATYTAPTLGSYLWIGSDSAGANQANGWIDELVVCDSALDAALIRSIFESDAPVFAESSTWSFKLPNNLVWADEEGLWMRTQDGDEALGVVGVNGKSWGGFTLDAGDLLIGSSSTNYIKYDISTGNLTITGSITITNPGDIDTSSLNNDAGWDVTADQFTNTLATIDSQVDLTETSLDGSGNLLTSVLPGTAIGTPAGAGLFLGSDYLGYYDSSEWKVFIDNSGNFTFKGDASNSISWDGVSFTIAGEGGGITNINGGNIQTGTVTANEIAANTITASEIASNTITANEIASNTITANEIASGTITTTQLSATAIDGMTITGSTIRTSSSGARIQMDATSIYGTDGTTKQWEALNADGKFTAGAGNVILDEDGISIVAPASVPTDISSLKFKSGVTTIGYLQAHTTGTYVDTTLNSTSTTLQSQLSLKAGANVAENALINIISENTYGFSRIQLYCDATTTSSSIITQTSLYEMQAPLEVGVPATSPTVSGQIYASDDIKTEQGISAGSLTNNPGTGEIWATGDIRSSGGLVLGSVGVNPSAGEARFSGGLFVGTTSLSVSSGNVAYTSGLISRKNSTSYLVYGAHYFRGTKATLTGFTGTTKTTANNGVKDVYTLASWPSGETPPSDGTVKAYLCRLTVRDATVGVDVGLGSGSTASVLNLVTRTQVANQWNDNTGWVPTDSNGDIYFYCSDTVDVIWEIFGYAL